MVLPIQIKAPVSYRVHVTLCKCILHSNTKICIRDKFILVAFLQSKSTLCEYINTIYWMQYVFIICLWCSRLSLFILKTHLINVCITTVCSGYVWVCVCGCPHVYSIIATMNISFNLLLIYIFTYILLY